MDKTDLLKNKNIILNSVIIFLALFVALRIYQDADRQTNLLNQQKNDELKKNKVIENIAEVEGKINSYQNVFLKKDISIVMSEITSIAKNNSVKITSIKPLKDEVYDDYIESSFLITITTFGYHNLGNFISEIESYKDIYLIEEVNITSVEGNQSQEAVNQGLNVNLKISAISYL